MGKIASRARTEGKWTMRYASGARSAACRSEPVTAARPTSCHFGPMPVRQDRHHEYLLAGPLWVRKKSDHAAREAIGQ